MIFNFLVVQMGSPFVQLPVLFCTRRNGQRASFQNVTRCQREKKKTGRLLTLFMARHYIHSIGTCQPILLLESASPVPPVPILECGKYIRASNYANSGLRIGQVGAAVPSWKSGKVCQGQ
jgi:hypothetical protein